MSTTPDLMNGLGLSGRQKRVMPSRNRRGGPGVGSTDVDIMILDTQKRKNENEPLIPEGTKFLLTTNSTFVPSTSSSSSAPFELELNNHAYERYFDRPEVLESYKAQQNIQTPEFIDLDSQPNVGSRFRPRIHEDDIADTSDAIYEKRHRKYETFEKRQRLREKEKLKHEQYKLKERMDQLRGMDGSAFLALPSASFSPMPGAPPDSNVEFQDLPEAHVNGAAAYHEGERRRKEMLDVAAVLEERYRILLPPERRHIERTERLEREKRVAAGLSASAEPEGGLDEEIDGDANPADLAAIDASNKQGDRAKLKIALPTPETSSTSAQKSATPASSTAPSRKRKPAAANNVQKPPPAHKSVPHLDGHGPPLSSFHTFTVEQPLPTPPARSSPIRMSHPGFSIPDAPASAPKTKNQRKQPIQPTAGEAKRPNKRQRHGKESEGHKPATDSTESPVDETEPKAATEPVKETGREDIEMAPPPHEKANGAPAELPTPTPEPQSATEPPEDSSETVIIRKRKPPTVTISESISAPTVRKRDRKRERERNRNRHRSRARSLAAASPHPQGDSGGADLDFDECLLMVAAKRQAAAPRGRTAQRHITAFGVKVPDTLSSDHMEFQLPWYVMPPQGDDPEYATMEPTPVPEPETEAETKVVDDDETEDETGGPDGPDGSQGSEEVAAAAALLEL